MLARSASGFLKQKCLFSARDSPGRASGGPWVSTRDLKLHRTPHSLARCWRSLKGGKNNIKTTPAELWPTDVLLGTRQPQRPHRKRRGQASFPKENESDAWRIDISKGRNSASKASWRGFSAARRGQLLLTHTRAARSSTSQSGLGTSEKVCTMATPTSHGNKRGDRRANRCLQGLVWRLFLLAGLLPTETTSFGQGSRCLPAWFSLRRMTSRVRCYVTLASSFAAALPYVPGVKSIARAQRFFA